MVQKQRFRIDKFGLTIINNKEETEANYFATELLVPTYKLKEIIFKLGLPEWDIINFCSDYFDVPKSVIVYKLNLLRLNENLEIQER